MEWYFILLVIIGIILLLLLFPMLFQFRFYINILNNFGAISICLFFIPIYSFQFKLKPKSINIFRRKKEKEVDFSFKNLNFLFLFFKNLFLLTKFFKLNYYASFSNQKNPMQTSLVCGIINLLFLFFDSFLNNCKKVNTKYAIEHDFKETKIKCFGYVSLFFMPIFFVISYIKTLTFLKGDENGRK